MSRAHIELLYKKLELSKWIVLSEYHLDEFADFWLISRPNGDNELKINFNIDGNGFHGAWKGDETISNAIACSIEGYPEIDLYFGKYSQQFQIDINEFINQLNTISNKNK